MADPTPQQKSSSSKEFSVVIPIYNEDAFLRPLFEELQNVFNGLKKSYEIIFVNDCSDDMSLEILKEFHSGFPGIVRLISFLEHSGQAEALRKGLDIAKGNIVFTLDADSQDNLADIPKMLPKFNEGYEVVCGWRKDRQGDDWNVFLSDIGNFFLRLITQMQIHDIGCDLRAYRQECLANIPLNWEGQQRFIPICLHLQGYRVTEIVTTQRKRRFGRSLHPHNSVIAIIIGFFRVLATRGKY